MSMLKFGLRLLLELVDVDSGVLGAIFCIPYSTSRECSCCCCCKTCKLRLFVPKLEAGTFAPATPVNRAAVIASIGCPLLLLTKTPSSEIAVWTETGADRRRECTLDRSDPVLLDAVEGEGEPARCFSLAASRICAVRSLASFGSRTDCRETDAKVSF